MATPSSAAICFAFNDQLPTEFECVHNILMHSPGGRPEEEHESKLRKRVIERYVTDLRRLWEVAFPGGRVAEKEEVRRSVHVLLEDHYAKVFRAPVNSKLSNTAKLNVSRKNRTAWRKEHSVLLDLLACDPAELSETDRAFYVDQKIARDMQVSKHVKRRSKAGDVETAQPPQVEEKVQQQPSPPAEEEEGEEHFLPLEALKMPSPESEVDEPAEVAAALIKQIEENVDGEDSELEELIEQAKCKFGIDRGNVSDCGESVVEVKSGESKQHNNNKNNRAKKAQEERKEQVADPASEHDLPASSNDQQRESDEIEKEATANKITRVALRPEIVMGIALTAVLAITRAKQLKYF